MGLWTKDGAVIKHPHQNYNKVGLSVGAWVEDGKGGGLYGRPPVGVWQRSPRFDIVNKDAGGHKGPRTTHHAPTPLRTIQELSLA